VPDRGVKTVVDDERPREPARPPVERSGSIRGYAVRSTAPAGWARQPLACRASSSRSIVRPPDVPCPAHRMRGDRGSDAQQAMGGGGAAATSMRSRRSRIVISWLASTRQGTCAPAAEGDQRGAGRSCVLPAATGPGQNESGSGKSRIAVQAYGLNRMPGCGTCGEGAVRSARVMNPPAGNAQRLGRDPARHRQVGTSS